MPVPSLPVGTLLRPDPGLSGGARFRIRGILGQGGFAITYLADDHELGGTCVIKEFAIDSMCVRDGTAMQIAPAAGREHLFGAWLSRFESEARLIHAIDHPGVVRVRAVWQERGTAYYAMQHVDGAAECPATPDGRPWPRRQRLLEQILDALEAVHARGLVHGDIKPPNVLVTPADRAILIDFGTARNRDDLMRTVTAAMFTIGYAPPELMGRSEVRHAGPWSDLYSWAMLAWGLTLVHPEDGTPISARARQHIGDYGGRDPYDDAEQRLTAAGVPANWARGIGHCLAIDPGRRPQSVAALRNAIAQSSATWHQTPHPSGAHSANAGTAGTGPMSPSTGHRLTVVDPVREQRYDAPPPPPPPPPPEVPDAVAPPSPVTTQRIRTSTAARSTKMVAASVLLLVVGVSALLAGMVLRGDGAGDAGDTSEPIHDPSALLAPEPGAEPDPAAQAGPIPAAPAPTRDLVGTWDLDVDATLDTQEMTEEERMMARAFMAGMAMEFVFERDGAMHLSATFSGDEQHESGTWRAIDDEGPEWTIEGTTPSEDGGPPETDTLLIEWQSLDLISVRDEEQGSPMVFTRSR